MAGDFTPNLCRLCFLCFLLFASTAQIRMNRLLTLTALIEAPTGLALLAVPSAVVRLLLGGEISGASVPLGRVAGAALFALGVACWLARYDVQSCAARGLVSAMVLYNLGAVVILGAAGLQSRPTGVALWPAVLLHAAMTAWCLTSLLRKTGRTAK
jgi:hypothetical protein